MKHKLNISVVNESSKGGIVMCKKKKVKRGLLKRLFGIDSDKVTIITPGDSVQNVIIQEFAETEAVRMSEVRKHSILAPSSKEWFHCGYAAKFLANKEDEINDAS